MQIGAIGPLSVHMQNSPVEIIRIHRIGYGDIFMRFVLEKIGSVKQCTLYAPGIPVILMHNLIITFAYTAHFDQVFQYTPVFNLRKSDKSRELFSRNGEYHPTQII